MRVGRLSGSATGSPAVAHAALRHSPQLGAQEQTSTNPTFGSEIRQAQFYYLDAMLLLISGKALHLYSYSLQRTPTHDAARARASPQVPAATPVAYGARSCCDVLRQQPIRSCRLSY